MSEERRQRLTLAVYDFAGKNPKLATPSGSFDRCTSAGKALIGHLEEWGINAVPVRFQGIRRDYPEAYARWLLVRPSFWTHYAILAEGVVVDITACQFDPDADFPAFIEPAEAADMWETSTVLEGFGDRVIGPLTDVGEALAPKAYAPY